MGAVERSFLNVPRNTFAASVSFFLPIIHPLPFFYCDSSHKAVASSTNPKKPHCHPCGARYGQQQLPPVSAPCVGTQHKAGEKRETSTALCANAYYTHVWSCFLSQYLPCSMTASHIQHERHRNHESLLSTTCNLPFCTAYVGAEALLKKFLKMDSEHF